MNKPGTGDLFEEKQPEASSSEAIVAHIDGGSRGNPGPSGYGVHIQDQRGETVAELSEFLGIRTNNYAEYSGLLAALDYALEHGRKSLKVISDSELMVKQIRGDYQVRSPELKVLYDQARQKIRRLSSFSIRHVLRAHNEVADRLANEAMDKAKAQARTRTPSSDRVQPAPATSIPQQEWNGVVRNGVIELLSGELPEGTLVKVRVKK